MFGGLSPSVVPGEAGFAAAQSASAKEAGFDQEAKVFAKGIEMNFSGGGEEGMLSQDDDAFSAFAGDALESNAQVDFFTGE